ncbi:MAG: hypothetical protein IJZ34_14455 [Lachnospiraceae bacterium]|nr:hypothetical protein [Lachnospiraceae bacterium]
MLTTTISNKVLNIITAKAKEQTLTGSGLCYLALSTTTPNADGSNFTEPTASSYERIRLNDYEGMEYVDMWGSVSNGTVTNKLEITSRECTDEEGWGEATHFGIFNAKAPGSGTLLAFDLLTDPDGEPDENGIYPAKSLTVGYKHVAVFRVGTLQLQIK